MADSINFVRQRQRELSKQTEQDRVWFRYSLWFIGGTVGILVVLLIASLVLSWQLRTLKLRQDQLRKAVLLQEDTERSYMVFLNKLQVLTTLLKQRQKKQEAMQFFDTAFNEKILISEIAYLADDGLLSITIQAPDIFEIENIFAFLDSDPVRAKFSEVNKSELKRSATGMYQMTITASLPQEAKAGGGS